jgi:hypothetical protein
MNDKIEAKNLSAQLQFRALGNPPSTLPNSAISNCCPGLEMDFRNAWKRIFVGIELHESSNFVVKVDPSAPELHELANNYQLMKVQGVPVMATATGPLIPDGPNVPLPDSDGDDALIPLEWSNVLAGVIYNSAGKLVECEFQSMDPPVRNLAFNLRVRNFFENAVIARDLLKPGELTQSLCSPWQNDYRECGCFYWAASRPDYVNVELSEDGNSIGHNWMQRDRTPETAKVYVSDDFLDERLLSYNDLFNGWEKALRFVIGNEDEPPIDGGPKK